jgi:hypothetical protein
MMRLAVPAVPVVLGPFPRIPLVRTFAPAVRLPLPA